MDKHTIVYSYDELLDFPGGSDGKASVYNAGNPGSSPGLKIPWRRKRQSTPVLLPGKFHRQQSLVSYSLWGRKESDTTERLHYDELLPKAKKEQMGRYNNVNKFQIHFAT